MHYFFSGGCEQETEIWVGNVMDGMGWNGWGCYSDIIMDDEQFLKGVSTIRAAAFRPLDLIIIITLTEGYHRHRCPGSLGPRGGLC